MKGSGGSGGSSAWVLSPKEALTQLDNGYDSPEIRAAILSGYGDIFGNAGGSQQLPPEVQRIVDFVKDGTMTPLEGQRHAANLGWSLEGLF